MSINFSEDGSVTDVCGSLEADAMLRLVFYILVRILFTVPRLYMICIHETQEKPYIKGEMVPGFQGVRMIRETRVNEYRTQSHAIQTYRLVF